VLAEGFLNMRGRLVLIPGMGADARLFDAVRSSFAPLIPPWLPVDGGDLASYARRYVAQGLVRPGDRLGGSSFGGMLAQEISRLIPLRCLLLITTCRTAQGVSRGLRFLAHLAPVMPVLRQPAPLIAKPIAYKLGVSRPEHRRLVQDWVANADPRFLRWAGWTAGTWRGAGELTPPVFQIHGSQDRILPVERSGAGTIVPGAGHLLPVTHPHAFTGWLRQSLALVG
jgi:pimeloyl-ACP methyl ester carboxylesterase